MSLNEDIDILQQIEDYLNDNLKYEERSNFEKKLSQNSELSELVLLNKQMKESYDDEDWSFIDKKSTSERIKELEAYFKSAEGQSDKALLQKVGLRYHVESPSKYKGAFNYKYLAIAASFLLLAGYFLFEGSFNTDYYSQHNDWSELPSLTSKGDVNEALLSKGEEAFHNKNYKEAKDNFESYLKDNPTLNTNALLYYGLSQLELNQTEASLSTFDKLIASQAIDSSKGHWYKALVYLKNKEEKRAIEQLEIISNNPEYYNYQKAQDLLKKIK